MRALLLILIAFTSTNVMAKGFTLTSKDIADGQPMHDAYVYNDFGCTGQNKSPALSWSGAPEGTKSYAVTVYDPDAPTGSGWWHWIVFNIDTNITEFPRDVSPILSELEPTAIQSKNDFGTYNYGGACPPERDTPHRYIFSVYALDVENIMLDKDASGAMVGYMINEHSLGKATLTTTYGR